MSGVAPVVGGVGCTRSERLLSGALGLSGVGSVLWLLQSETCGFTPPSAPRPRELTAAEALEEEYWRRLEEEQRAEEDKRRWLNADPEGDSWAYSHAEGLAADAVDAAHPDLADDEFSAAVGKLMETVDVEGEIDEDGEPQARFVFTITPEDALREIRMRRSLQESVAQFQTSVVVKTSRTVRGFAERGSRGVRLAGRPFVAPARAPVRRVDVATRTPILNM